VARFQEPSPEVVFFPGLQIDLKRMSSDLDLSVCFPVEQVAKKRGVPIGLVAGSLGRNRAHIDIAVNLPFVLLCCFAAAAVARRIWRRYPPAGHGWIPGAIMTLFLSLVFAVGSVMLGEVWSWVAESYRVGNSHMSYRVERLPWARYRTQLFAAALIVFWVAATGSAPYRVEPKERRPPY
jgi:hypothetical protein